MKKVKKTLAVFCVLAILSSLMTMPASAETKSEVMYASIGGGATVSSASAQKGDLMNFFYSARPSRSDGWNSNGKEYVYFRGRDKSGANWATDSARRNYTGQSNGVSGSLPYLSSYGKKFDYYKIAIQYDSGNPYDYVWLKVNWEP